MSETAEMSNEAPRLSWTRSLTAGLVVTVIMTGILMLTGMNIIKRQDWLALFSYDRYCPSLSFTSQ
jgi:hypothetical protein